MHGSDRGPVARCSDGPAVEQRLERPRCDTEPHAIPLTIPASQTKNGCKLPEIKIQFGRAKTPAVSMKGTIGFLRKLNAV